MGYFGNSGVFSLMTAHIMDNKKGFTIVEVLTASTILLVVLTAIFSTYFILSQYISDTSIQAVLQSHARLTIEKITRDIRLASDVNCPLSGNSITLTFDPGKLGQAGSTWTSRYRLVAGQILFSPDTSLPGESVVVDNVNLGAGDTLFQYDAGQKLVTIDLRVENTSLTNTLDTRLITIIQARNVY